MGAAGANTSQRTLLVFGDSLSAGYGIDASAGWVSLLDKRLRAEGYGYRVVNASVSGETTTGGLSRLPRALATHRPVGTVKRRLHEARALLSDAVLAADLREDVAG